MTDEQPHFVRDYTRLVNNLSAHNSPDQAFDIARGGQRDTMGAIERAIVRHAGLCDGQSLLDFGCGGGALASALASTMNIDYIGMDVVQAMLDYAALKTPSHYEFILNHDLSIPLPLESVHMACAFSVFTHLHHHETVAYLRALYRVVGRRGRLVFSFMELAYPPHQAIHDRYMAAAKVGAAPHLDAFFEREDVDRWAKEVGWQRVGDFIAADEAPWEGGTPLGQTVAILQRP